MKNKTYVDKSGNDVIDHAFNHSIEEGTAFCRWNIIKYAKRAGIKADFPTVDIDKIIDYAVRWKKAFNQHLIDERNK